MAKKQEQPYRLRQGYFPPQDEPELPGAEPDRPAPRRAVRSRPIPSRVIILAVAAVALVAAGIIFLPRLIGAPAASAPWGFADVSGTWVAYSNGEMVFEATVDPSGILINWTPDTETRALYWHGTFAVPSGSEPTRTVVSAAYPREYAALMASDAVEKTFTVTRTEIRFDATMMGVTKTFTLRRP